MELQTVAISFSQSKSWIERLLTRRARRYISTLAENLLLILAVATANPDMRSLWTGAAFLLAAWVLLAWMQGFGLSDNSRSIVGPLRFVRRPGHLASTLLALALSISARSFPALILSFLLLPYFYRSFSLGPDRPEESGDLDLFRYRQHVPALVPTLFPYFHARSQATQPRFSWRRALFHLEPRPARLLIGISVAWVLFFLIQALWLPHWAAILISLLAVAWESIHLYRTGHTH